MANPLIADGKDQRRSVFVVVSLGQASVQCADERRAPPIRNGIRAYNKKSTLLLARDLAVLEVERFPVEIVGGFIEVHDNRHSVEVFLPIGFGIVLTDE